MLIALGGLPGAGKSTLARALARRIGAVHLRIDTIEQALRNAGLDVSGPEGYLAARDLAEDNLRIGKTVIVDAVNPLEITRDYWRETVARLTLGLVEIEVVCSDQRGIPNFSSCPIPSCARPEAGDVSAMAGGEP